MVRLKQTYIRILLSQSTSSGYTLIESLVALVVVGILITSVAPMLALTTASRVQARRVDQATQALRAYIDGVRGGALPLPQKFVVPIAANFRGPNYGFAPSDLSGYPTAVEATRNRDPGTLIDTNNNGFDISDPQDLVIQAIRPAATCTPAVPAAPPAPAVPAVSCARGTDDQRRAELNAARNQGFLMVVRVYRADAFENGAVPDRTEQSSVFIGTLGNRGNPLAATVAEIYPIGNLNDVINRAATEP